MPGMPSLGRPLVGQRQQPPDPAGDRRPWSSAGRPARRAPRGRPAGAPCAARPASSRCSGASSPRISRARSTRAPAATAARARAAQVGVVEVRQPVRGRPHLAAHPALLPGQHALVRAEPGQQRADRVAVADHHPVDAAHLAGLGHDAQPPGRPDQRQRRLRTRAGDLESRGPARLGQRAVGQERAAPGGLGVADRPDDHLRRQAAHRSPAASTSPVWRASSRRPRAPARGSGCPCAARRRAATISSEPWPKTSAMSLRSRRAADPVSSSASMTIWPADEVQAAGEAQHRRHLRLAAAGLGDRERG